MSLLNLDVATNIAAHAQMAICLYGQVQVEAHLSQVQLIGLVPETIQW
jgi:hypothetical protein